MFPSRTGVTIALIWSVLYPRNLEEAILSRSGSWEMAMLATASTRMLMASLVGISSRDVKSAWIFSKDILSTRCMIGITKQPFPMMVLLPEGPVTTMATLGGACLYITLLPIITSAIITMTGITIVKTWNNMTNTSFSLFRMLPGFLSSSANQAAIVINFRNLTIQYPVSKINNGNREIGGIYSSFDGF